MPAPFAYATISEALSDRARSHADHVAYIDGDRPHTFAEADAASDRIAGALLARGFECGDRIGIIAPNQIEWVVLFFAAAKIGVAVVGLTVRYRDSEIEYMANDSRMKAVFTVAEHDGFDFLDMFRRLSDRLPALQTVVAIGGGAQGQPTFEDFMGSVPDRRALSEARSRVRGGDLAMVIYTSGTTGRPKGTALTHRSMLASAGAQADHVRANDQDLIQLAMPLNHVGGITCGILTQMLGGGTCELVPVFKADTVLEMMRRHPPTQVSGVPTMLTLLLMNPRSAEVDLSGVRLVITGGTNVDDTLLGRLQQRMPQATLMNLYGLSESSGAIVMTPWECDDESLMTSIGRPLSGAELRVVADGETDAAPGEVGELRFRGLGVVEGYIGAAASASPIDDQGWLRSGDLGEVDARGYIYLRGRQKDMYIQGGFNVYPAEVEGHIARHPDVLMVAGIGVPDPVLGEIGRYYIVPRPEAELTEQAILDHCASLADYKIPRQIVFRGELPLTPAGKIQKAALRAEEKPQ